MISAADFSIERQGQSAVIALRGDWTATTLARVPERLTRALAREPITRIDAAGLGRLDTAGAFVLQRAGLLRAIGRADAQRFVALVDAGGPAPSSSSRPGRTASGGPFARLGVSLERVAREAHAGVVFQGRLVAMTGRLLGRPSRLRLAPTVALMQRAGLDALPIVAATSVFVGATIAFLGATLLARFGAQVFSVELVGTGVLREFGVLVTCIILAGRSASSFAAELGAMKMSQEVDAMRTLGVDPFEALVAPRLLAMLAMTPLLVAVAMGAGLLGGAGVIWVVLDLSPAFFVDRLLDNVGASAFWLGMVKAPPMAAIIALIGCRQGLAVGGDVEQLGRRVTAAVVQALFAIIICDALFALLFLELGF